MFGGIVVRVPPLRFCVVADGEADVIGSEPTAVTDS